MIPDYPTNLRGGNNFEINTFTVKHEPNLGQNIMAKGILKIQPKKQQNKSYIIETNRLTDV